MKQLFIILVTMSHFSYASFPVFNESPELSSQIYNANLISESSNPMVAPISSATFLVAEDLYLIYRFIKNIL